MHESRQSPISNLGSRWLGRVADPHQSSSVAESIPRQQHHQVASVIRQTSHVPNANVHAAFLSRTTPEPFHHQQLLLQLQRLHGNRYAQRVVELSRKPEGEAEATTDIEAAIAQARGSGQPLDQGVQVQMESAFGADFSGVRVHTGTQADTLNQSLNARAFTTGQDIFFRQGEYHPSSSGGQELLAHELTHVVQQTGGIRPKLVVSPAGDAYEQEADQVAKMVVNRLATHSPQPAEGILQTQPLGIQRKCTQCDDEIRRQPMLEEEPLADAAGKRTEDDEAAGKAAGKGMEDEELLQPKLVSSAIAATRTVIQRDLATPPPAVAAAPQPDLTESQIREAIAFNRARYNEANTRLIQDLLGGPITGTWTEENIVAIAATQEEYGLTKDGKVGFDTFQFLNREQRLEGMSTQTANCLTAFQLIGPDTPTFTRTSPTECQVEGHFRTASQFSPRCNCSEFQYRQFIRGHFRRERGGVVTDFSGIFNRLPSGNLTAAFQEDGDTADVPPHYGHRNQPADNNPVDHYINNAGADDQANGCRYRNEDFPGATLLDCQAGDVFDVDMNFRGEIQRSGTAIQQKFWAAIRRRFTAPP